MQTIQTILAFGGLLVLLVGAGLLRRWLINSLGSKAIAATQKNKPKSGVQKFFGW